MQPKNQETLSSLLLELKESSLGEEISFAEICNYLSKEGFTLLMILFSFPLIIPLPIIPGFTAILGMPLLYFSYQIVFHADKPSLPDWINKRCIKTSHLHLIIDSFNKYLTKLEQHLKPRISYFSSASSEKLIGFLSLLCSISIVLPIAFGNIIPALGVLFMYTGLLKKDGLVIMIGIITSIIGICISLLVVYLFFSGARMLIDGSFFDMLEHFKGVFSNAS